MANSNFERMTPDDKRELVRLVFSGKTEDGKRMGVYLSWLDDVKEKKSRRLHFALRGHIVDNAHPVEREGTIPMSKIMTRILADPDRINAEYQKELFSATKSSLSCGNTGRPQAPHEEPPATPLRVASHADGATAATSTDHSCVSGRRRVSGVRSLAIPHKAIFPLWSLRRPCNKMKG